MEPQSTNPNLPKPNRWSWGWREVAVAIICVILVGLALDSILMHTRPRGSARAQKGFVYLKNLGQALSIYSESNDGVPVIDLAKVPDSAFDREDFHLRFFHDDSPHGWGNKFREWQHRRNANTYPPPRQRVESVIDLVTITGRPTATKESQALVTKQVLEQGVMAILPADCRWQEGDAPKIGRFCSGPYVSLSFDLSIRKKGNRAIRVDRGYWKNTFYPEWQGDPLKWLED